MSVKNALSVLESAIPEETKVLEWQPIKDDIVLNDPPPFSIEAMPEALRDMALDISRSRKVPVAMAATTLLAAVGMAIGRNVYFVRKRGFEGRANLYALVFAARGERKSVTFKPVLAPFFRWMRGREEQYRRALKTYMRQQMLISNLETALVKPGLQAHKRHQFQDELDMLEHDLVEQPRNPHFIADDVTPEALTRLMKEAGGTAGIFSDDARLVVKMLLGSVYSTSGEGREEFLLRPFDGEQPMNRQRVGTGNDIIERPCIGMLLMLQTDFLRKIGGAVAFFDSGLASRCLFCYPESWVGKRDEHGHLLRADDDYEIPLEVEKRYEDLIRDLLDRAYRSKEPEYYTMTEEAIQVWKDFYNEIESESGAGGKYAKMLDFAIRYPSQVLRLALQLAILKKHLKIDRAEVTDAIKLMRYYMVSAERCFTAMQDAQIPDGARRIIMYWQKKPELAGKPFTVRQLENALGMTKGEVDEALKFLVEHHFCRYLPKARTPGKAGRSPSPMLEINPQFYE